MNELMLFVNAALLVLELIIAIFLVRRSTLQLILIALSLSLGNFTAVVLLLQKLDVLSISLFVATLIRSANLLRIAEARMHAKELKARSVRTIVSMGVLSVACVYLLLTSRYVVGSYGRPLLYLQVCVALSLFLSVIVGRFAYRYKPVKNGAASSDLPSVSICIPARNETEDLSACIESALSTSYKKLEILVLDDCSHDKTPEVIKGYAHQGVRFINGKEPRDDWLAKNAAYDRLADEATGDILLFMGVDVRLSTTTVKQIIDQLGDKDMISVLPKRMPGSESAFFVQPLRYWWELGLWRFGFRQKPVLSTFWAIRKTVLEKTGGFEAVKKTISVEVVLSKKLSTTQGYKFLIANESIGLYSLKKPADQYMTAVRKRYPQLKRQPENLLALIVFESVFVLGPFVSLAAYIYASDGVGVGVSLVSIVLLSAANLEIYKLALTKMWHVGIISVPFIVVADWFLMIRSMYSYEFGSVIWKERNICIPILSVEKSLPKI